MKRLFLKTILMILCRVYPNPQNPKRPYILYTTKSHTGAPVPVYAFGPGSERFAGILDNTNIPSAMADLWKLPLHRPVGKK